MVGATRPDNALCSDAEIDPKNNLPCCAWCSQAGETGEDIAVVQIVVGKGAKYRPLARGSHYAITPTGANSTYGDYSSVAIIDLETQVHGP